MVNTQRSMTTTVPSTFCNHCNRISTVMNYPFKLESLSHIWKVYKLLKWQAGRHTYTLTHNNQTKVELVSINVCVLYLTHWVRLDLILLYFFIFTFIVYKKRLTEMIRFDSIFYANRFSSIPILLYVQCEMCNAHISVLFLIDELFGRRIRIANV